MGVYITYMKPLDWGHALSSLRLGILHQMDGTEINAALNFGKPVLEMTLV